MPNVLDPSLFPCKSQGWVGGGGRWVGGGGGVGGWGVGWGGRWVGGGGGVEKTKTKRN